MEIKFAMVPAAAITDSRLSSPCFRTLAALARHARRDGHCFPEIASIAFQLGCPRSSIQGHIKQLESLGYLQVHRHMRPGGGRARSSFTILYPKGSFRPVDLSKEVPTDVGSADIAMSASDVGSADIALYRTNHKNRTKKARVRAPDSHLEEGGASALWRSRLAGFKATGLWLPEWGDAPGAPEGDTRVPLSVLIEFGYRRAAS
ncbi:MAG TPA: helix-turn-helix domain-containing protein [Candidatus Cybelea sp.]|nr:helix-turn-helix domain-containing protein [Candidatus Cybelea sp.]